MTSSPSARLDLTCVDVATSSSDLVWQAAADGALPGAAFLVGEQTAGRGRRGAGWSSARGGMYLSVLLRPSASPDTFWGLSFVAALSIREAIAARLGSTNVQLKWPNDILAGAGKICGILLEARGDIVVIGTGVNIAPVSAPAGAKLPATSFHDLGDEVTTPEDLARDYASRLLQRVADWERDGFAPARLEWLDHCAHLVQTVRVTTGSGVIAGAFDDLGHDGALVIRGDDGTVHRVTTGDVELTGRL